MAARQDVARLLAASLFALLPCVAAAGEVIVAVASNFAAPMQKIAAAFEAQTHDRVRVSIGSTGALAAQIRSRAPFELLLAADDEMPARLEKEGLTVPGSRFTYAVGRLVLWSPDAAGVDSEGRVLLRAGPAKVAIANPKLAPYGRAAIETMQALGVYDKLRPRIVEGENIAQAWQFVASGNAAMGFVATSQVFGAGGSSWVVPAKLHGPLKQDAVILNAGRDNPAAHALATFLKAERARGIIRAYGYELP